MRDQLSYLVSPIGWFIVGLAALFVLRSITLPAGISDLFLRITQSITLITLFVLLYQASKFIGIQLAERSRSKLQEQVEAEEVTEETLRLTQTASRYLGTFLRAVIVIIGVVTVLSIWIPDITGILAGVGIGGLVLALAAQDTAANLFASIAIMLDHPFRIGDWIETTEGSGTIEQIGLRSTRIRAVDQSLITIPNSTLGSIAIVNGTTRAERNIVTSFYIDHQTSSAVIEQWMSTLRTIVPAIEGVIPDSTMIHFNSIAEQGFEIGLRYRTPQAFADMLDIRQKVNLAILQSAEQQGIHLAVTPLRITSE